MPRSTVALRVCPLGSDGDFSNGGVPLGGTPQEVSAARDTAFADLLADHPVVGASVRRSLLEAGGETELLLEHLVALTTEQTERLRRAGEPAGAARGGSAAGGGLSGGREVVTRGAQGAEVRRPRAHASATPATRSAA